MQDSLKGVLVTLTIAGLFITCILNFIIMFPQEQGVTFTDNLGQSGYLTIASNNDTGLISNLNTIENQSSSAFNEWDVTQGFMGSNTLKQGQDNIRSYSSNIFSNLGIIATQLFGQSSPILYAIGVFSLLASTFIIYQIIKFVRSGN